MDYKDAKKTKPLCIFHPKMIIYKRNFYKKDVCIFQEEVKNFSKNIMKFGKK